MSRFRDIRVLPVVLAAVSGLAVLKVSGLVLDGGYMFSSASAESRGLSWAQENLNFPTGRKAAEIPDITGSVQPKPKAESAPAPAQVDTAKPAAPASGNVADALSETAVPAAERAVLERLQERRKELDARAREMDIRDNLLKAAEQRINARVEELKGVESRIALAKEQKAEEDVARFKSIVTMYEGMKPKDAARIFDRLEMPVLIEVASKIAPRKMADILGLMQPEAAERLTVELARRAGGDKGTSIANLPKIEGRPQSPEK